MGKPSHSSGIPHSSSLSDVSDNKTWESQAHDVASEGKAESEQRADESRGTASPIDATIRSPVAQTHSPPPDGGPKAWLQCIMGHLTILSTWGYVASYGVFQTYYVSTLGHPPSDISWVGSVQIFLLFFIGTFSGRLLDAGYFRITFVSGIFFQLLGIFTASVATRYYQIFLSQGLTVGIGMGLQFCPVMGVVASYFSKKRTFALASAACGGATGGIVFPLIVEQLLPKIGYGWTVRVLAFVVLFCKALELACLRTRLPPRTVGPLVEFAAFKELPYTLLIVGMFFNFWALYYGYYYIGAFGRDIVGISYSGSINLLITANAVGVLGRLIPALIADYKSGAVTAIMPLGLLSGVMVYCWIAVSSEAGLYVFAALYGLFSNGIQGLWPASLSSLTTDLTKTGTRMGMGFTIVAFACLTGPPLGGALVQADNGQYLYAQIWAGTSLVVGSSIIFGARCAKVGLRPVRC